MPAALRFALVLVLISGLSEGTASRGQDAPGGQSAMNFPPVPKGVEVLARGPVHEAFATLTADPVATKAIVKAPPKALEELPPDQKPASEVNWIGGYWAWDDERNDFLWVSGIWRLSPPGQRWVSGYWRADGQQWRWVPGFWTAADKQAVTQPVTYLPEPPTPPEVAPPGTAPTPESFYVPGHYVWHEAGYADVGAGRVWRTAGYAWTAGYWGNVQPGYVWVPTHYRWTPGGYLFVSGYWDLAVAERGVLYAPVIIDRGMVGPAFVYTPAYAVRDTIVVDALFVRPSYCHYYFGDYYGPAYRQLGFESCVVYSRRRYDAIFVYERYAHRTEPRWEAVQLDVSLARHAGQAPRPPRTLVLQRTAGSSQVLVPSAQLAAAKGVRTIPLDPLARDQAKQQAQAIQQVAVQRRQIEVKSPAERLTHPRPATLTLPPVQAAASQPTPSTPLRSQDTVRQTALTRPNAVQNSIPGRPLGSATGLSATPPAANRAPTGPPTSLANAPRSPTPAAAVRPLASTGPGQPFPQVNSPLMLRPGQASTPPSSQQRPLFPGAQPAPTGALQRPPSSQPLQQRPTSTPNKPDQPEKPPPAPEQKPS